VTLFDKPINSSETFYLVEQKVVRPLSKNDREEKRIAFEPDSAVLRHKELYHGIEMVGTAKTPLPTLRSAGHAEVR
jgi:hypothetical protein